MKICSTFDLICWIKVFQFKNLLISQLKTFELATHQIQNLWKQETINLVYTGKCKDKEIEYKFDSIKKVIDENEMLLFKTTLNELFTHVTQNLFASHFEETYHDFVFAKKMMLSIEKKDVATTISLMDMIAGILERDRLEEENKISTHERSLLRGHMLTMGVSLLNDSDLIIDPPDIKRRIQLRILNNVMKAGGLYWSSSILVPTIDIFLSTDWIGHILTHASPETELEYMSMLVQIPWRSLDNSVNSQQIKRILKSLDEIVKKTAPLNYVSLLTLIGKISAYICYIFPEYVVAVIDMLMNSRPPTRLANIANLCLFSWKYLDGNATLNLYSLLYMKGNKTTREYGNLSFEEKVTHRRWFTDLITTNFPFIEMIYRQDEKLFIANQKLWFPILRSFVEIAMHHEDTPNQDFDLPKLILEELVFFELQDFVQEHILKKLKEELNMAIESILKEIPRLYSVLIVDSNESADSSRLESLVDFTKLVADKTMITWLSKTISRKSVEQDSDPVVLTKSFFASKLHRSPKDQTALALKVFDSISWKQSDKLTIFKGILIVLGSYPKIPNLWRLNSLSRMVKQNVFKFDVNIIDAIFSIEQTDLILSFVKVSVAAAVIISYNRGQNVLTSRDGQEYNFNWFLNHLTQYTYDLSSSTPESVEDFNMYAPVIFEQTKKICKAFLGHSNSQSFVLLENFCDVLNKKFGTMSSFCTDYMKNTLTTQSKDLNLWFQFWTQFLYPRIIHATKPEATSQSWSDYPLDLLIHSCHLYGYKTKKLELNDLRLHITHFEQLISKGYLWVVYQLLNIAYPMVSDSIPIDKEYKEDYQSGLWLARETATLIQDPIFASLIWEFFFWVYFNESPKVNDQVVSDSVKSSMTKMFLKTSQSLDKDHDVVFSLLYRNFASWEPKLIFSSEKPSLMVPNESQCFLSFAELYKPPYPSSVRFNDIEESEEEPVQYKKDNSQALHNLVLQMLPSRYRPNNQILDDEIERYEEYIRDIDTLLDSINYNPKTISIEIDSLFSKHDQLCGELKELDIEHTSLLQNLWKNETINSSVNLACGSLCRGPASLKIQSFKIVPGPPSVNDEISQNRSAFHIKFYELFTCARSLARVLSLLKDVVENIIIMEDQDAAEHYATSLFYDLLPLIEYTQSRNFKLFTQEVLSALKSVGEKYIDDWESQVKQSSLLI